MAGDITASDGGVFELSSAALITALDAMNVGGATAADETGTIHLIPCGEGQVQVIKLERSS